MPGGVGPFPEQALRQDILYSKRREMFYQKRGQAVKKAKMSNPLPSVLGARRLDSQMSDGQNLGGKKMQINNNNKAHKC